MSFLKLISLELQCYMVTTVLQTQTKINEDIHHHHYHYLLLQMKTSIEINLKQTMSVSVNFVCKSYTGPYECQMGSYELHVLNLRWMGFSPVYIYSQTLAKDHLDQETTLLLRAIPMF